MAGTIGVGMTHFSTEVLTALDSIEVLVLIVLDLTEAFMEVVSTEEVSGFTIHSFTAVLVLTTFTVTVFMATLVLLEVYRVLTIIVLSIPDEEVLLLELLEALA
jgi:hypothetical protein